MPYPGPFATEQLLHDDRDLRAAFASVRLRGEQEPAAA